MTSEEAFRVYLANQGKPATVDPRAVRGVNGGLVSHWRGQTVQAECVKPCVTAGR